MESPYGSIKLSIAVLIRDAAESIGAKAGNVESTIDFSKGLGDISCSIAFRLARELKKPPQDIAKSIAAKVKKQNIITKVTADNGFVNFYLDRPRFTKEVVDYSSALETEKDFSETGRRERVIIEYPSANPVHPLHVGQLRNALLGDALSNVYDAIGYTVERQDYIDDLGLQMMEALWGYLHFPGRSNGKKFDHRLGEVYVEANKYMEANDIKGELSELAQLVEQDGTRESITNHEVAENCVMAQHETLFNLGIYHTVMIWESDIVREKLLQKAMDTLLKEGFIEKLQSGDYSGCIAIDLAKVENLPKEFKGLKEMVKVLVKSDGVPTYVAKDIAFHMWKFGMLRNTFKYKAFIKKQDNGRPLYTTYPDGEAMDFGGVRKSINIIDVKQSFPQDILKLAFRIMKRDDIADNIIHLAYGRVELEEGTLAGRKGTWVGNTADDLLGEATKKARELLTERFKLTKNEKEKVAKAVAVAAIKFEFLKMSPEKTIIFSWKWALSFEGNSGPYCQYTYARAMRLIEDAKFDASTAKIADLSAAGSDHEFALVKLLSKEREVVEKTAAELRTNVLTDYAIDIASAFSKFYEMLPILKAAKEEEKNARLALTLTFARTMANVLKLLGIEPIARM